MKNMNFGKILLGGVIGSVLSGIGIMILKNKELVKKDEKIDKFRGYYNILNQWLELRHEGKKLEKYFEDKGYETMAIYGMGELGNRLYEELSNQSIIDIKYAIDKNAGNNNSQLEIYNIDDVLMNVDVIVVTAIFAFDEIEAELKGKTNADIISIEDMIYEL